MKRPSLYKVLSILFAFVVFGFGLFTARNNEVIAPPAYLVGEDIFDMNQVSSQAFLVLDDSSGNVLFEKNSRTPFEIASVVKIMTAIIAMEELRGKTILIDRESYRSVGDTGLLINEKWVLENLVMFMMSNSSNDAAEAIAKSYPRGRSAFIERMNDRARELGLALTYDNPTGLTEDGEKGGSGTAADIARLISYAYKKYPGIFEYTVKNGGVISSKDKDHLLENTNLIASSIAGLQASKTGYTDKSGGALALRINMGLDNPYIFIILGANTRESRFEDIQYLVAEVGEYLSRK